MPEMSSPVYKKPNAPKRSVQHQHSEASGTQWCKGLLVVVAVAAAVYVHWMTAMTTFVLFTKFSPSYNRVPA